jgi:hypothetical protein
MEAIHCLHQIGPDYMHLRQAASARQCFHIVLWAKTISRTFSTPSISLLTANGTKYLKIETAMLSLLLVLLDHVLEACGTMHVHLRD